MAIGATTNNKKQEQLNKQQGVIGSTTPYSGMAGVSSGTANQLGNYQSGYKPSETVTAAQQQLAAVNGNKPQSYTSKYGPQLENILKQITNPGEFKYDFNGDELFKYYADLYSQKGKQASMDAMGQAAGLTGGYGNSYAQQVGQQGYQQYLLSLYDKGMDLYDRAYQRNRDRQGDLQNAYGILSDADATEYGRYRDTVGDWQNERDYATNRADTERNFDYAQYADQLDYWTGLAQIENAAYNTEADRQEAIRQYEQNFAENQRQYDTSLAEQARQYDTTLGENRRQYDTTMAENQRQYDNSMAEQIRQANLDEAYRRDTLGEQIRQNDLDEAYRRDTLSEQIRQNDLDEGYRRDTLAEQMRQADLDEAYRRDTLGEQVRQYDTSLAEQQRQADLDEAYRRDTLGEQIRQNDLDEAYRRDTLAEDIRQYEQNFAESQRQFDANQQYNYDALTQNQKQFEATSELNWAKMQEDQRQFDATLTEKQREYNQNVAMQYASAILANGQIPSSQLLVAAGLSYQDAMKLLAMVAPTGGGGGGGSVNVSNTFGAVGNTEKNIDTNKLSKNSGGSGNTYGNTGLDKDLVLMNDRNTEVTKNQQLATLPGGTNTLGSSGTKTTTSTGGKTTTSKLTDADYMTYITSLLNDKKKTNKTNSTRA